MFHRETPKASHVFFKTARSTSLVDALDAFILRVEWRFEVSLGLVGHAHPLQGELAALDEIVAHLIRKRQDRGREVGGGGRRGGGAE